MRRWRGCPPEKVGKFAIKSVASAWDSSLEEHWIDFQAAIHERFEAIRKIADMSRYREVSISVELGDEFPPIGFGSEFGELLSSLDADFGISVYSYP